MADIRLGRYKGHWNLIANLPFAQFRIENKGKFIGGTEARSTLRRTYYYWARIFYEFLESCECFLGVIDVTYGLGVAFRAKAGNFIERQVRSCGDNEIIVGNDSTIFQGYVVLFGINALRTLRQISDILALHHIDKIDINVFALAPPHGNPRV